jgi:hypothetical protein
MSSDYHVNVIGHDRTRVNDSASAVETFRESATRRAGLNSCQANRRIKQRPFRRETKVPIVNIGRVRASIGHLRRRTKLLQMRCPDGVQVAPSGIVGKPEPVRRENDMVREDGASHCPMIIIGACVGNGCFGSRRSVFSILRDHRSARIAVVLSVANRRESFETRQHPRHDDRPSSTSIVTRVGRKAGGCTVPNDSCDVFFCCGNAV